MRLYLVQHAEAVSKHEDPTRGLSKKGIEDAQKVAAFVKRLYLRIQKILHSGKKRSIQTAEILGESINAEMAMSETDGISPMDDPEIWFDRISGLSEDLMLVGHLPHLARLAALLVLGDKEREIIDFEMGCIACLKKAGDDKWTVDWIIKPRLIQ